VIRRPHWPGQIVRLIQAFDPEHGVRKSNPIDRAFQNPRRSESPASNSANLMLDEPPLIVRMHGLVGFVKAPSSFREVLGERLSHRFKATAHVLLHTEAV